MTTARDLYGVPLADFVRARDELARVLRRAGERDAAASVAALRRPSPGAWALNQVARDDEATVDEFLETAKAMRAATQKALGGDPRPLREIRQRERDAVRGLVDAALARLRESGKEPSDSVSQRIATTVRAALSDEHFSDLLRTGMLTDDLRPSGLGIETLTFSDLPRPPREEREAPRDRASSTSTTGEQPADEDATRATRAREAQQARRRRADDLERDAERLQTVATTLERAAQTAEAAAREQRADADRAAAAAAEATDAARTARAASDDDDSEV
jgi:hypothetical protein